MQMSWIQASLQKYVAITEKGFILMHLCFYSLVWTILASIIYVAKSQIYFKTFI